MQIARLWHFFSSHFFVGFIPDIFKNLKLKCVFKVYNPGFINGSFFSYCQIKVKVIHQEPAHKEKIIMTKNKTKKKQH